MYILSLVSAFKFGFVSWRSLVSRDGSTLDRAWGWVPDSLLTEKQESKAEEVLATCFSWTTD